MPVREDGEDRLRLVLASLAGRPEIDALCGEWNRLCFGVGFLMGYGFSYERACEIAREVTA